MPSDDKLTKYSKKIKMFNGLQPDEIESILKQGRMLEYRKGQTIFHEGQMGSNLFILFGGEVGIFIHNDMIAKCRVGDAFGEMSVLNHKPHSGTAAALSDVRVFVLEERQLNLVLEKGVAVRLLMNVIHILSGHLEGVNAWNAALRKKVLSKEDAAYNSDFDR